MKLLRKFFWKHNLRHHLAAKPVSLMFSDLPEFTHIEDRLQRGRDVRAGYSRGWGIQFGDLRYRVLNDPLYQEAVSLALGRSILAEDNRINLFLLMKFYLHRIPQGDIIEFGSYKGGNALFMARVAQAVNPQIRIFSLDTFTGMPATDATIDSHRQGDFGSVDLDELRAFARSSGLTNLEFVQGLFQDTAPDLLQKTRGIAMAHIDCDIYSAIAYSYDIVKPHMVAGGYFIFDDALFSSCIGATQAVEDLLISRDGLNSEQVFPHFVFRSHPPEKDR